MRALQLILLVLLVNQGFSQEANSGLHPPLSVSFDIYENAVVHYTIEKDKSIYKAAKLFHIDPKIILDYNEISNPSEIKNGSLVKIPIDFTYVFRGNSIKGYKTTKFIPLQYTLKPKDNLFRIAKVNCQESIEAMMKRNNLSSKNLRIGQVLTVSWLPVDTATKQYYSKTYEKKEYQYLYTELPAATTVNFEEDFEDEFMDEEIIEEIPMITSKGVAIWTKSSKGHSKFALHPTAKLNSEIELFNPVVNRRVKAKVIGRIPKDAYTDDVSVIISPATAASLGALDQRFSVVMSYVE